MHTATFMATILFDRDVARLEEQISAVITQIPHHWTIRGADIETAANLFCAPQISEDGCAMTYSLPLGSETKQGLFETVSALKDFCDKKIAVGEVFDVKQTGNAAPPVIRKSFYGVKDAVCRMVSDAGLESCSGTIEMGPVEMALRHVSKYHPDVTHVFFNGERKWLFCDDAFNVATLQPAVDQSLLESAANSVSHVPAGFCLNDFS